jgi:excinuclease ABC subunit A
MRESGEWIKIRGARTHNLQSLSCDIPVGAFTVITGPSGSGKSSLAFDTLYAEGRRRFLETLRGDKRALFHQLQRPDVDAIEGLPPVVCVSQHTTAARPRSTLGTVTEIHDHLRLLFARFGTRYCSNCDIPIHKHSLTEIVRAVVAQEGRKFFVLAPLVIDQPGDHKDHFRHILQAGFLRARVDGVLMEIRDVPKLDAKKPHTIEMIVDRLIVKPGIEERLRESLTSAVQHSGGRVIITDIETGDWLDDVYSTKYACIKCGESVADLEPRDFSFNNPHGACPRCTGLGQIWELDPKLVIPDRAMTLDAVIDRLNELAPEGLSMDRKAFLPSPVLLVRPLPSPPVLRGRGAGGEGDEARKANVPLKTWPDDVYHSLTQSLLNILRQWSALLETESETPFASLSGFIVCPDCHGARLSASARSVRFADIPLHEITALSVDRAADWFNQSNHQPAIATLLHEIQQRLRFLQEVGLGYLTLDRPAITLSGGEAQRARLATHLGGGLLGVCYILDEPTMGLHPRDTQRLIDALRKLQAQGNTVIVVEHDESVMRQADWHIDIGPGAGKHGGRLLYCANRSEPEAQARETTKPLACASDSEIMIRGARHHNLKNITARIPLARWTCVTGVSGSGKSSLARDILVHAARRHLGLLAPAPGAHDRIDGLDQLDKVLEVDQKPIGRSSRSNPASYIGLFDEIRKLFATTKLAKIRGYKANRFSFNAKGGRCEQCQGQGTIRIELAAMPELRVTCQTCDGKRFNAATLEVRYRGLSISEVLDLPIEDARTFFANVPMLQKGLQALDDVGLGYLALGQPANTLSGGEAQRVKLANELSKTSTGKTLYLFDEPTSGLHSTDITRLLRVFRQLVDAGNTVIVIEHHLDVILACDWVLDLGPEGGAAGGELVAAGSPTEIAQCERSITGRYLRDRIND